jgi:hypothetical protein
MGLPDLPKAKNRMQQESKETLSGDEDEIRRLFDAFDVIFKIVFFENFYEISIFAIISVVMEFTPTC